MPAGSAQGSEESGEVVEVQPSTKRPKIESSPVSSAEAGGKNRWDDDNDSDIARSPAAPSRKIGRSRWQDDDDDPRSPGAGAHSSQRGEQAFEDKGADAAEKDAAEASPDVPPPEAERRDMLLQCRTKDESFDLIKDVGAGTYGLVSKARDKHTNAIVALKKIKLPPTFNSEGFPMTSVREINILLALKHPNIVDVTEVVANKRDVYMVMEYVQQDLKHFLEKYKTRLKIGEVKRIVHQMLEGMGYLHDNWVLHRDLKPANILYDHFGNIKICDFGLARHYGDPTPDMTPTVVTRSYRGPEICLGVTNYTPALDIWSVGVIAAELLTGKAPFIESKSDIDLVNAIGRVIGSPHGQWKGLEKLPRYNKIDITKGVQSSLRRRLDVQEDERVLPFALDTTLTNTGFDLIESMLRWDPGQRISAEEALRHPWFDELPRVTESCFMPQTDDALRKKYR